MILDEKIWWGKGPGYMPLVFTELYIYAKNSHKLINPITKDEVTKDEEHIWMYLKNLDLWNIKIIATCWEASFWAIYKAPNYPQIWKIVPVHEQTPPKEYLSSSSSQTDWGNGSLLFFAKKKQHESKSLINVFFQPIHVGWWTFRI